MKLPAKQLLSAIGCLSIFGASVAMDSQKSNEALRAMQSVIDGAVATNRLLKSTVSNTSNIVSVRDTWPGEPSGNLSINYPAYNRMLQESINIGNNYSYSSSVNRRWFEYIGSLYESSSVDKRRSEYIGSLYESIVNTYNAHPTAAQVMHHLVASTDFTTTVIANVVTIITGVGNQSGGSGNACNTQCFDFQSWGYTYHLCVYMYTKAGAECNMCPNNADLQQILLDGFTSDAQPNCIGRCFTLFDAGASVAYVRWVRENSDITMSDLGCEGVTGWGKPPGP